MAHASRRGFLKRSVVGLGAAGVVPLATEELLAGGAVEPRQATGVKVGEVSDTSAIVWLRLTAAAQHNARGAWLGYKTRPLPSDMKVEQLKGACPGAPGRVRLRYGTTADLKNASVTEWLDVTARTDFTRQIALTKLQPGTVYHYSAETSSPDGKTVHAPLRGRFQTAPPADQYADIVFTVVSCSAYKDLDHADGYNVYPAMGRLDPKFFVHTGDNVYYDNDEVLVNSVELARHHWHRMHALPRHVAFHRHVPGYWEKDDHDCLFDDCWPGQKNSRTAPLTFAEGLALFREQVPLGERTYRTFRWGRGLQIWLTEGRDFRSPNNMKDGPTKTIWGAEQKKWLMESIVKSNADYKLLISPTPLVGPDRKNKNDNHSNAGFTHEGNELRHFFQKHLPERFAWINGDRHWQYHSVHPETRVHEFGCGTVSDEHAGGTPGEDKRYHRFHRVRGGFLSVTFRRNGNASTLVLRHHDVNGKVVYEYALK